MILAGQTQGNEDLLHHQFSFISTHISAAAENHVFEAIINNNHRNINLFKGCQQKGDYEIGMMMMMGFKHSFNLLSYHEGGELTEDGA